MAQGDFTKEEADRMTEAVEDLFRGIPKRQQSAYIGHLNDILLFMAAATKAAPIESRKDD